MWPTDGLVNSATETLVQRRPLTCGVKRILALRGDRRGPPAYAKRRIITRNDHEIIRVSLAVDSAPRQRRGGLADAGHLHGDVDGVVDRPLDPLLQCLPLVARHHAAELAVVGLVDLMMVQRGHMWVGV